MRATKNLVYQTLVSGLSSYVSDRVYAAWPQQDNPVYPMITYRVVGGGDAGDHADGVPYFERLRFEIKVYGGDDPDDISDAVCSLMASLKCSRVSEIDYVDFDGKSLQPVRVLDFRVLAKIG